MHFSEALLSFPCLSLCLQRMLFCRGCFSAVVWTSQSNFAPSSSNSCPGWCNWENLLFCFVLFLSHTSCLLGKISLLCCDFYCFSFSCFFFCPFVQKNQVSSGEASTPYTVKLHGAPLNVTEVSFVPKLGMSVQGCSQLVTQPNLFRGPFLHSVELCWGLYGQTEKLFTWFCAEMLYVACGVFIVLIKEYETCFLYLRTDLSNSNSSCSKRFENSSCLWSQWQSG